MSIAGPTEFSDIERAVSELIADPIGPDPTVRAYMIALAALMAVARQHGAMTAADMAGRIAIKLELSNPK